MEQQKISQSLTESNSTIYQLLETDDMLKYIQQLNNFLQNSQIGNNLEGLILSCIRNKRFEHFKLAFQLYMVKFNNSNINKAILTAVNNSIMDIRFVAYLIYTLKIVDQCDNENHTLLLAAIYNEDLTIIRLLLINKAQLQINNLENMMDYVLERDLTVIVRLLISFHNAKPIKEQNIKKYNKIQTKWYQLAFKQKLVQTYKENEGIKHFNFRKYILSFYFMLNIILSLMIPFKHRQETTDTEDVNESNQLEYFRWGCITIIIFTMIIHLFLCCFNNALPKPNLALDILIYTNFHKNNLCLHCRGTKDQNTKHCDRCHSCIPQYSHHCIWIDNCVGGQINKTFKIFVILVFFICFFQIALAILILINYLNSTYNPIPIFCDNISNYYSTLAIILLIINLFPFIFYLYALSNSFCKYLQPENNSAKQETRQFLQKTVQTQDLSQEQ